MLDRIKDFEILRKAATTNKAQGIIVLCEIYGTREMYELQFFTKEYTTPQGKYDLWTYYRYNGRFNAFFETTDNSINDDTIIKQALQDGTVTIVPHKQAYGELGYRKDMPTETYSLLVSNVGYVRIDEHSYKNVKELYDEYVASYQYEQVSLWSSLEHDPIEMYDSTESEIEK